MAKPQTSATYYFALSICISVIEHTHKILIEHTLITFGCEVFSYEEMRILYEKYNEFNVKVGINMLECN